MGTFVGLSLVDGNEPDRFPVRREIDSNDRRFLAQQELALVCEPDFFRTWGGDSRGDDYFTRSILVFGSHFDERDNRHLKLIILHDAVISYAAPVVAFDQGHLLA